MVAARKCRRWCGCYSGTWRDRRTEAGSDIVAVKCCLEGASIRRTVKLDYELAEALIKVSYLVARVRRLLNEHSTGSEDEQEPDE